MVTPHVPQIVGLVYSLPYVLVHLHDCKQSDFRREDSGCKFGALGLGMSNWAKSVAMQVYQAGGKRAHRNVCPEPHQSYLQLQCLLRTMSELSPAPSANSKDDVLQRKTKESCTSLGGVKELPLKRTRIVFSFGLQA